MPSVQCPGCSRQFRFNDAAAGRVAACPRCGEQITLLVNAENTLPATFGKPGWPSAGPAAQQSHLPCASKSTFSAHSQATTLPKTIGRYEIRGVLGAGAFGQVLRAYDSRLQRDVAVKLPHPAALQNEEACARFLREPQAAAQLCHPNIVPVYDAGFEENQYYIASAFIEGRPLQEILKQRRLTLAEAAELVRQLAEALSYAHQQGIVHRDVKPANIMVDGQGRPHLMDFGIARWAQAQQELTQDARLLGTPAYMSPEQAGAKVGPVGPASDQFSLGVMLYEMLCGQRPFDTDQEIQALLYQIREQDPTSPRKNNPSVSRDLETICLKALRKSPADRYANCQALADDLQRVLRNEPVLARPIGSAERLVRWGKRNPMVAGLTGAVVISLAAGVLLASYFLWDAERQRRELQSQLAQTVFERGYSNQVSGSISDALLAFASSIKLVEKSNEAKSGSRELTLSTSFRRFLIEAAIHESCARQSHWHGNNRFAAISNDGTIVATADDRVVVLWNMQTRPSVPT